MQGNNYLTTDDLTRVNEILQAVRDTGHGDIMIDYVTLVDSNGENIGRITYESSDGFVFRP
jgi:hypothetical protein